MYQPKFEEMTSLPAPVGYVPRSDLLVTMRPDLPAPEPKLPEPKARNATATARKAPPSDDRSPASTKAAPKAKAGPVGGHRAYGVNTWESVVGQVRCKLALLSGPIGTTFVTPARLHSDLDGALTMDQIRAACEELVSMGDAVKRRGTYRRALATDASKL